MKRTIGDDLTKLMAQDDTYWLIFVDMMQKANLNIHPAHMGVALEAFKMGMNVGNPKPVIPDGSVPPQYIDVQMLLDYLKKISHVYNADSILTDIASFVTRNVLNVPGLGSRDCVERVEAAELMDYISELQTSRTPMAANAVLEMVKNRIRDIKRRS